MNNRLLRFVFFLGLFISSFSIVAQFTIPNKSTKANPDSVYDYIGLLSKSEKATLENKLIKVFGYHLHPSCGCHCEYYKGRRDWVFGNTMGS